MKTTHCSFRMPKNIRILFLMVMKERLYMESQKLVYHLTEDLRKSLPNLGMFSCSKEDLKIVASEKDSG